MNKVENEKVSQVIKWIRKSNGNMMIWDTLCGDSWFDLTVGDCIDMLEQTAEAGMYEYALILIARLNRCQYVDEAITNIIVNRINETSSDVGVITECIKELKNIAKQRNIVEKNVQEFVKL